MVALAFTTLTMSAQETKWNVTAGVGMSNIVGSDTDGCESAIAYKVGITYDFGISENFSVIPGAEFINKASKFKTVRGTIDKFYLQIPILAAYKLPLNDNMSLALKAGPYVAYGITGSDIEWDRGGKTNIFDSNGGFERFDAGAKVGASLEFESFNIGIEFSRGFMKLDSDYSQFNQAFGVVLGYKF